MTVFFEMFFSLISTIGELWEWLLTPNATIENLTGLSVIPLALILAPTVIIIGVVRALL